MTEAEWLACTDPYPMLEALRASGRATERKLRLFAVAVCRRVWPLLTEESSRTAVAVAERFVDGLASRHELDEARTNATPALSTGTDPRLACEVAAWAACAEDATLAAKDAAFWACSAAAGDQADPAWDAALKPEQTVQCHMLRCIFGPVLFRPLPPVAPAVLAWNGGTVARLAAGVYEERGFTPERMGVLADAAEEAGVTDADDLLAHLCGPGPHVRGCWALDLLLGKG
jgi:hypothetical protein